MSDLLLIQIILSIVVALSFIVLCVMLVKRDKGSVTKNIAFVILFALLTVMLLFLIWKGGEV